LKLILEKQKIVIVLLVVGIFLAVNYIVIGKWLEVKENEKDLVFQSGYNVGLENAVTTLFYNTDSCNTTTISLGNNTRTIIDFSCIESRNSFP